MYPTQLQPPSHIHIIVKVEVYRKIKLKMQEKIKFYDIIAGAISFDINITEMNKGKEAFTFKNALRDTLIL